MCCGLRWSPLLLAGAAQQHCPAVRSVEEIYREPALSGGK